MNAPSPLPSRLRYALLTLSGVMLGFAFPPFTTGILAGFAFIPLFVVFEEITSLRKALQSSYFAFFVFNLLTLWWVGGFVHAKDPYMMVAGVSLLLGHPLFMTVPILAFTLLHRTLTYGIAVFSFPFLWIAFEYLHSITQLAFPWLALGNTQTHDLAVIQFASYTGVYGVSFWLLWINVCGFFLYRKLSTQSWKAFSRQSIGVVSIILLLYLAPKIYGNAVLRNDVVPREGKTVSIGIVQPNIDPFEKWQTHAEEQLLLLQQMTARFAPREVDLIVWPETALPFFIFAPQKYHIYAHIRDQVDSLGISLFSGIPDFIYYDNPDEAPRSSRELKGTGVRYDNFNSSMLLQPHTSVVQKYAKMILVPFAERVPYAGLFTFLRSLQWDFGLGGWAIGTDTTVFQLQLRDSSLVRFSSLICYESIYPGFVAEFVRRGAQFLTIITNDSWWGNTFGPYQHQQIAVMRAIENRRWVVRCANGGISCFIDPLGNTLQPTEMFTQTALIGDIETTDMLTFYTRHGDLFAQVCLMVTGFLLATAFGKRFYQRTRTRQ